MLEIEFVDETLTDPDELARVHAQHERHCRNSDWLAAHWGDVLPQARGKFVAVAGEETFIADTPAEAWAWAKATHPEDDGAMVRYVRATVGPRIYADYWQVDNRR